MDWSKQEIIEFLKLYERESIIWDPYNVLNKNRSEVHYAWKRIQDELPFKKSLEDLKRKKDSLMGTFRKLVAKVKASEGDGYDSDEVFKPQWFAFDIMAKFLRHLNVPTETIKVEKLETNTEEQDDYIENGTQDDNISNILVSSTEPTISTNKRKATSDDSINEMTKKSKTTQDIIFDKIDKAYDIFQSQFREKDECDLFGELLAKRLRALRHHQRDSLMHDMENMMYQYLNSK
ncbi:uncharacterized protein LOC126887240 [Diabrotica virgifera virgifera]|uniref:Uncharacterized protein LOC114335582 n=1 Tax=Diabrotica virgifera virgifera TaxID=50390 RepID=A0A6P7G9Z2_DIAVI|nr:uncharacterized protein LOC126887240 [Diabrotica virgifera virgifera]